MSGVDNYVEMDEKDKNRWIEVKKRRKKTLATNFIFKMILKIMFKPDMGAEKYNSGRNNNKETRELGSKVDVIENGKQLTMHESCVKISK